jgi:hypothetical protein
VRELLPELVDQIVTLMTGSEIEQQEVRFIYLIDNKDHMLI